MLLVTLSCTNDVWLELELVELNDKHVKMLTAGEAGARFKSIERGSLLKFEVIQIIEKQPRW